MAFALPRPVGANITSDANSPTLRDVMIFTAVIASGLVLRMDFAANHRRRAIILHMFLAVVTRIIVPLLDTYITDVYPLSFDIDGAPPAIRYDTDTDGDYLDHTPTPHLMHRAFFYSSAKFQIPADCARPMLPSLTRVFGRPPWIWARQASPALWCPAMFPKVSRTELAR